MTDIQRFADAPIGTSGSDTFYSETYEFVRMVANDLMANKIELPSFPDVVLRLRRVLADERTTAEQIERVVAAEPVLAARLMRIANSAALNPSGKPMTHLRVAVARMGHDMVRLAALSFAMAQLRRVSALHSLRPRLETLWRHALTVAALAHILARRCRYVQPDEALLTGLLHVVGELYIYAHINRAPAALQEDNVLQCAVRDWHAATAKAILEAWGFAEHMTRAVEDHELLAREHTGSADLTDVLTAANLIADYAGCPERLELSMQGVKAFDKLGFDGKQCKHMLQESAVEIAALQDVLDDADPIHRRTPSTPSAIRSG